jgi:hypothetical protein
MSCWTVSRIITEAGIASEVQLGYEMALTDGLTVSGDGTTHKHVNYESRHINMAVPSYSDVENPSEEPKHHNRLLGVHSSADHKSQTQVNGWKEHIMEIVEVFMRSPLAKAEKLKLKLEDFYLKLKGMNSDHAEDQKKVVRIFKKIKEEIVWETLGGGRMVELPSEELDKILESHHKELVKECGGIEAWNAIPKEEQAEKCNVMMRDIAISLGEEEWLKLGDEAQHEMMDIIWVGCGMHKDLNGVKGGNIAMQTWWEEAGEQGPLLLANKDNAAVIENAANDPEEYTGAERRALEVSACGGVKATTLAGFIFNHKDDKKGHQDSFSMWFEQNTGRHVNFPDTSNTRYQSHCNAAAELITYLEDYIKFMEYVRDRKQNQKFNHIEENLYRALQDAPTITELAVLTLYAQAITHPYMRHIRGPGTEEVNMLELGPLHNQLKVHIQKIIGDPGLLLNGDASFESGSLDGLNWETPEAIEVVHRRAVDLPHLQPLLVAFLKGALATWERFTSEFEIGGQIDLATPEQRKLAWMPPTNDANEGALGSYRLFTRRKPNFTLHHYNALKRYQQNGTEAFLAKHGSLEMNKFLHKEAHRLDSSQLERKRRADLQAQADAEVAKKREKKRERAERAAKEAERIEGVLRVEDIERIRKMTVAELKDQLKIYRALAVDIPLVSHLKKKADLLEALLKAVDDYKGMLEEGDNSDDLDE